MDDSTKLLRRTYTVVAPIEDITSVSASVSASVSVPILSGVVPIVNSRKRIAETTSAPSQSKKLKEKRQDMNLVDSNDLKTDNILETENDEKLKAIAYHLFNVARDGGLDEDKCISIYNEALKQGTIKSSSSNSASSSSTTIKSTTPFVMKELASKKSGQSSSSSSSFSSSSSSSSSSSKSKLKSTIGGKTRDGSSKSSGVSKQKVSSQPSSSSSSTSLAVNTNGTGISGSSVDWSSAIVPQLTVRPKIASSSGVQGSSKSTTVLSTPSPFGNGSTSTSLLSSSMMYSAGGGGRGGGGGGGSGGVSRQVLVQQHQPELVQQSLTDLWKKGQGQK
jgi:hypothetical protein